MASNAELAVVNGNANNQPDRPYHVVKATPDGEPLLDTLESLPNVAEAQTRAKEKSLANDETYLVMETMMIIKPVRQAAVIYSRRG